MLPLRHRVQPTGERGAWHKWKCQCAVAVASAQCGHSAGHRPQLEGHRARFHRPHSADTRIKPYRYAAFAKLIRVVGMEDWLAKYEGQTDPGELACQEMVSFNVATGDKLPYTDNHYITADTIMKMKVPTSEEWANVPQSDAYKYYKQRMNEIYAEEAQQYEVQLCSVWGCTYLTTIRIKELETD